MKKPKFTLKHVKEAKLALISISEILLVLLVNPVFNEDIQVNLKILQGVIRLGSILLEQVEKRIEEKQKFKPEASKALMIPSTIILYDNGMVMAFDANGEQMPEYQGTHKAVVQRLNDVDLSQCWFGKGKWGQAITPISQTEFFNLG